MAFSDFQPNTQANILGAAGGAAGALFGGAFNLGGMALQNKYNKEMAEIQNQYNIEAWNRQNEYNSPTQQMNRLKEAGLNPNLIYDMGNPGNSSSAPQLSAPNAPDAQSAMRDAARAINPLQVIEMAIKLRKDLAEAESAEQRANILGIQGIMAGSELNALLNPMYRIDLEGNISMRRDLGLQVLGDPNNRYFKTSTVGMDYFSLINALQAQKEIVGSKAKVISSEKTASQSQLLKNQSALLKKELKWFNASQVSGIFGKFTPILNSILLNLIKRH